MLVAHNLGGVFVAGDATSRERGQSGTLGDQGDGGAAGGDVLDEERRGRVEGGVGVADDSELGVVVRDDARAGHEGARGRGGQVGVGRREGRQRHADGAQAGVDAHVVLGRIRVVELVGRLHDDALGE
jgi:hypothetical protein